MATSTNYDRSGKEALIDAKDAEGIIQGAIKQSAVLSTFRRLPNMSSNRTNMRVLDALPMAYFVDAEVDNGRKKLTDMAWDKKTIYAEEIAVIMPIKEDVLDDASVDIFGAARPRIEEQFGRLIDDAIILGIGKPRNWRAGLLPSIINAGAEVKYNEQQSLYSAINDAMVLVEESGYVPNQIVGGTDLNGKFRMMLDDIGQPVKGTEIGSLPRRVINNGAWDKSLSQMIVGDFSQAVYSIRQDVTYKILTEAVIQDPTTGEIKYNLAQEDMVALRVVMRLGWEIPNPINILAQDESVRFPFASIAPKTKSENFTQKVTFEVKQGEAALSDKTAKVVMGGNVKNTGTEGKAEFNVPSGTYGYKVTLTGEKPITGSVKVESSEVTETVTFPSAD